VKPTDVRALYEQRTRTLQRHPSLGLASARASARLAEDGACEVRHGLRKLRVELPAEDGGDSTAPHPGELMRACLGACLALDYQVWSARLGVSLAHVEVDVTAEFDTRGPLGVADDASVGWTRVLFDVRIESDAEPAEVRRVVEQADRLNALLANLTPELTRVHRLLVSRPSPDRNPHQP